MAPKQIGVPIMIQQQYFFRLLLFSWHDIRHFLVVSKEEEEEEGMVEKGELPISLSRVRTHGPRGLYSRLQTFFPLNLESGRKIAKLGLGRARPYHSLNSSKNSSGLHFLRQLNAGKIYSLDPGSIQALLSSLQ